MSPSLPFQPNVAHSLQVSEQFAFSAHNLVKIAELKSGKNDILTAEKQPLVEIQVVSLS